MKALVMYDSAYGNTANVAAIIASALRTGFSVKQLPAADTCPADLDGVDLLVVGSATQGGRPMKSTQDFVDGLNSDSLNGVKVAAFDTRMEASEQTAGLRVLMKTIGYAAPKIARSLRTKGGNLVAEPAGFIVNAKEGPLNSDELIHAQQWAKSLIA